MLLRMTSGISSMAKNVLVEAKRPIAVALSVLAVVGVIFSALAYWPQSPTYGAIIVDTPEVYTRERLVNDRLTQQAWLDRQLEKTDTLDFGPQAARNTSVADSLRIGVTTAAGSSAPAAEAKAFDAGTAQPTEGRSSNADLFRDALEYRNEVRTELLRNQLDDAHDLEGNTLYRISFNTTVVPGENTSALAVVSVRVKKPSVGNCDDCAKRARGLRDKSSVSTVMKCMFQCDGERTNDRFAQQYADWIAAIGTRVSAAEASRIDAAWSAIKTAQGIQRASDETLGEIVKFYESLAEQTGCKPPTERPSVPAQEVRETAPVRVLAGAERDEEGAKTVANLTLKCLWTLAKQRNPAVRGEPTPEIKQAAQAGEFAPRFRDFIRRTSVSYQQLRRPYERYVRIVERPDRIEVDPLELTLSIPSTTESNLQKAIVERRNELRRQGARLREQFTKEAAVTMKDLALLSVKYTEGDKGRSDLMVVAYLSAIQDLRHEFHAHQAQQDLCDPSDELSVQWAEDESKAFAQWTSNAWISFSVRVKPNQAVRQSDIDPVKQDLERVARTREALFEATRNLWLFDLFLDSSSPLASSADGGKPRELIGHPPPFTEIVRGSAVPEVSSVREVTDAAAPSPDASAETSDGAASAAPDAAPDGGGAARPLTIRLFAGFASFSYDLMASGGSATTYTVEPRESAQAVSNGLRGTTSLMGSLSGNAPIQGGTTNGDIQGQRLFDVRANAVERHPLVVGFSAPENAGKSTTQFGWLLGPRISLDAGGDDAFGFRHQPAYHSIAAVLSVPSWWSQLSLDIATFWLTEDGRCVESGGDDLKKDCLVGFPDGVLLTGGKGGSNLKTATLLKRLPSDVKGIEQVLIAGRLQREPLIVSVEVGNSCVARSGPAQIVISGQNLWRNPVVTLGGRRADRIAVLPNMEGVVAEFDQPAARSSDDGAPLSPLPLRVWTSDGVTDARALPMCK